VTNIDLGATFPGEKMVQGKNILGYLRTRTFYTPERKYAGLDFSKNVFLTNQIKFE
jgi:hypothetical protein